tara:strand:+ start:38 stop:829 length:792 start_codon:yes stop_codon:yes gene_type:complete
VESYNGSTYFKIFKMAIKVDEVYTTVLSVLNKEQRGYLTPYEFNQIATQVQLEIFESYFESLTQQLRDPQNSSEYVDRVKTLEEKIATFEKNAVAAVVLSGIFGETTLPTDTHRFGMLQYTNGSNLPVEVEKLSRKDFLTARRSPLAAPSIDYPICYLEGSKLYILPGIISVAGVGGAPTQGYQVEYVRKPINPVWNYTVGSVGQYIFDPVANSVSKDFEISDIDQSELILKILAYAGVVVRDQEIIQAAAGQALQIDQSQQS